MPKINRYNVYDNGKIFLENVTHGEIKKELGKVPNIINYVDRGTKYQNRYTFEVSESDEERKGNDFVKEWEDAVKLFKNVILVKQGGRKLCVGKF